MGVSLGRPALRGAAPALSAALLGLSGLFSAGGVAAAALPTPVPLFSDAQQISASTTPPSQSDCFSVGRRCFAPAALESSYNMLPLYASGNQGQGVTIALIESFGSDTIASDLANYNTQFGLPHMCGEPSAACGAGIPT